MKGVLCMRYCYQMEKLCIITLEMHQGEKHIMKRKASLIFLRTEASISLATKQRSSRAVHFNTEGVAFFSQYILQL